MNRDKQPVSACNMSVAQQEYVAREIRRHRQVTICRVMLLVLLLATCTGLTALFSAPL